MPHRSPDHAVVLGGSISGLLAARLLADTCAEVTILDRDALEPGPGPRRGVGQAGHIHALLARGQQLLEDLFPGLTGDLAAAGAPVGDVLGDARLLLAGRRLARTHVGLQAVSASRGLIEDSIRSRVRALPGVRFAPPCDIAGLRLARDGHRVDGVRILRRAEGSVEETLDADLVIDAMGRGSRTPHWLESLGFGRPREDHVRVDVRYVTCRYRLPADILGGDFACIHGPTAEQPRGGALARQEAGVWMLTLFGMLGDHPPRDAVGFEAFARSLHFGDIHAAIHDAEPIDDAIGYRFAAAVRRRYERMRRFPGGLVVLGDALCSFNPIYGQGMTVAALQAMALRERHRPDGRRSSRAARAALARAVDAPWELAIGADLSIPGVAGPRSAKRRLAAHYVGRLQAAAASDPELSRAFVRVTGLVDPPEALLRPHVVRRVLRRRPKAFAPRPAPRAADAS
jgi:2-polyprenyl-6-methoxyphenol hydroxylase-like FAD-dependent oxidoreductase